jgi:aryl-alcohol dehydrogenase-like predicted oxidoreductase
MHLYGMGCWQIGGPLSINGKPDGWSLKPQSDIEFLLQSAYQSGIRFFDTSSSYGISGRSENLLGEFLSEYADVEVSTKFGNIHLPDSTIEKCFSKDCLMFSLEKSLQRLKRNNINTFLLHGFPPEGFISDELLTTFEDLKNSNVIQHWGVSPSTFEQVKTCIENRYGDTLEWVYHILDRRVEALFEVMQRSEIRLIARSPLASGLIPKSLVNKVEFYTDVDNEDYSSVINRDFKNWVFETLYPHRATLEMKASAREFALRFFLDKPVFKVIPGIRNVAHFSKLENALRIGKLNAIEQACLKSLPISFPGYK